MKDDRLPIVLVILDGLGDRACPELDGQTPSEAAATPVLDALADRGQTGLHVPFGPGRATSSEMAHWSLFGFQDVPFPGRVAIEGLGQGLTLPAGVPMFQLALRAGAVRRDALFLGARARPEADEAVAAELFAALGGRDDKGIKFELKPLRTGESVLLARGASSGEVSDTDALFDHIHPWMRPCALDDARDPIGAADFALTLQHWLLASREVLIRHPVNEQRRAEGLPALDVPVTKWASYIDPAMPSFFERVGLRGAAVTDSALYRGLARLLGMEVADLAYDAGDPAADMARRVQQATELLAAGAEFVHVHVKATDAAGHAKNPTLKRDVIAATDAGLEDLLALSERAMVAVTGDHATPSVSSLLHSGDPTPFLVAGPGVGADTVNRFGERYAMHGAVGRLAANDVLPLLVGFANRPFFHGHRPGLRRSIALPNHPEPMPLITDKE